MLHPFSQIVNRTETSRILCKPTAADQNLAAFAWRSLPRSTYPRIRRHIDFGTQPYSWEMRSVLFPDSRRSHQAHNGQEFPSRRRFSNGSQKYAVSWQAMPQRMSIENGVPFTALSIA